MVLEESFTRAREDARRPRRAPSDPAHPAAASSSRWPRALRASSSRRPVARFERSCLTSTTTMCGRELARLPRASRSASVVVEFQCSRASGLLLCSRGSVPLTRRGLDVRRSDVKRRGSSSPIAGDSVGCGSLAGTGRGVRGGAFMSPTRRRRRAGGHQLPPMTRFTLRRRGCQAKCRRQAMAIDTLGEVAAPSSAVRWR